MFKSKSNKITARKDALGHTSYYDGFKRVGYSTDSPSGRTVYYDSHGKILGSSSNKLDNKIYYNKEGKYIAESRKDNFGYTGYYNSSGKKIAESKKSLLSTIFKSTEK